MWTAESIRQEFAKTSPDAARALCRPDPRDPQILLTPDPRGTIATAFEDVKAVRWQRQIPQDVLACLPPGHPLLRNDRGMNNTPERYLTVKRPDSCLALAQEQRLPLPSPLTGDINMLLALAECLFFSEGPVQAALLDAQGAPGSLLPHIHRNPVVQTTHVGKGIRIFLGDLPLDKLGEFFRTYSKNPDAFLSDVLAAGEVIAFKGYDSNLVVPEDLLTKGLPHATESDVPDAERAAVSLFRPNP